MGDVEKVEDDDGSLESDWFCSLQILERGMVLPLDRELARACGDKMRLSNIA